MMVLPIALISFLPLSTDLRAESPNTVNISQQIKKLVTGVVVDAAGLPLIGVNVSVKGTTEGTITDLDGKFSLNASSQSILIVSYIGYKTVEVPVDGNLKIVLKEDSQALDEVVVVGYGVARKSDLTGAVGQMGDKEVQKRQVVNPVDALSGKIAGVIVNNNSGRPGGSLSINIRGFNSINASNAPLFVIDGVVGADIAMVNPNEIESMNVLKDASSTAIYGARGAGGVVIVTTKKGSFGTGLKVSYNLNLGISKAQKKIEVLNSKEFMSVLNKAFENDGFEAIDWHRVNPSLFDSNGTPLYDTNWQDEVMKTAFSNRHYLTLSYGNERSKTTASIGYQKENGVLLREWYKRISGKITNTFKINSNLELNTSLAYNNKSENRYDDYGVDGLTTTRTMIECFPVLPIAYDDGTYSKFGDFLYPTTLIKNNEVQYNDKGLKKVDYDNLAAFYGYADNPVQRANDFSRVLSLDHVLGNAELSAKIVEGLVLRINGAAEVKSSRHNIFASRNLIGEYGGEGGAEISITRYLNWQNENFLTYDKSWKDHKINAMIGLSFSGSNSQSLSGNGQGFVSDFFKWNNLGVSEKPGLPSSGYSEWKMNSYFFRGNYSYANKYLATISMRYDGSSVFGSSNRYAYFPSAALAWVLKEEGFLKDNNLISNLKVRVSAGKTGNAGISPYSTLPLLGETNLVFADKTLAHGVIPNRMSNSNLKWETTTQYDLGVELGLLNNRINIIADYYDKKTTDLLLDKPVSWVAGYSTVMDNVGCITNKGVELTFNTHNIKSKDFNWFSTLIFNLNRNKVIRLSGDESDLWIGGFIGINYLLVRKGEPLYSVYGLVRDGAGTWGTDEVEEAARYGKKPGDKKYVDKNKDGKIDYQNDGEILGNAYPKFEMSFSNTITYKNFDLSLDIHGKYGNKAVNMTKITAEQRLWYANTTKRVLDYWTPENQNTMIERPRTCMAGGGSAQELQIDSDLIEDASYIRFKNLTVGYTFSSSLANKLRLKGLRFYCNLENFLVISSYSGYDPEVSNKTGQGAEFYAHPKPINVNFGVNVDF